MEFMKKHMSLVIVAIILVLALVGFLLLKSLFFPNEAKAIYGSRLEGRDKVEISDATKAKIEKKVAASTSIVKVRIAGRIIYIAMTVVDGVDVGAAKELANSALEELSDSEKSYYDIQAIISSDTNNTQFPIIGYKHHSKAAYTWTKDR